LHTGFGEQPLPASRVADSYHFVDPAQDITYRNVALLKVDLTYSMCAKHFSDNRAQDINRGFPFYKTAGIFAYEQFSRIQLNFPRKGY
jgi:hypothetical protein